MNNLLTPQPPFTTDKAANTAALFYWRKDLFAAASAELPDTFDLTVPWNDHTTGEPLTLTFTRMTNMPEVYAVLDAITVPHLDPSPDGDNQTRLSSGDITYDASTLLCRAPSPLDNNDLTLDFAQRIHSAAATDPTATRALLLSALLRVLTHRMRQPAHMLPIDGGHDRDIAHIQDRLADLDTPKDKPMTPDTHLNPDTLRNLATDGADDAGDFTDGIYDYDHTHESVNDGSPAMLVTQTATTITLVNEDGYRWTDPLDQWRPINNDNSEAPDRG